MQSTKTTNETAPGRIIFTVAGEPKGQPRPRAFAKAFGDRIVARVYDAGTAEGWKSLIADAIRSLIPPSPIVGPIRIYMLFNFPRPKSHYRTGKRFAELRPDAPTWHLSKPDTDNLVKAVKDCLTVLRVWSDDSQVCDIRALKKYSSEFSGMHCCIEPIQHAAPEPSMDESETLFIAR